MYLLRSKATKGAMLGSGKRYQKPWRDFVETPFRHSAVPSYILFAKIDLQPSERYVHYADTHIHILVTIRGHMHEPKAPYSLPPVVETLKFGLYFGMTVTQAR